MKDLQLEICCGDIAAVNAAKQGGATRIELCSGLSEGGLTPSRGLISAACASGIPEVNVLIRPRSGDFLYSESEIAIMVTDIRDAIALGATGVVIGALTPDGDIDVATCSRLIDEARNASDQRINITFHRAFDLARDAALSLEDVVGLGCNCLLTSGMASSAVRGIPMLKKLSEQADNRIIVMAGSGVNPANAADIIKATGVKAIHSTARKPVASKMKFHRPSVPMGAPGMDEYAPLATSSDVVEALRRVIVGC